MSRKSIRLNAANRTTQFRRLCQPIPSPVLAWLPLFVGSAASAAVAAVICPAPRPRPLDGPEAIYVSAVYVALTALAGALAFLAAAQAASRFGFQRNEFRRLGIQFISTAVWLCPLSVFLVRDSFWILPITLWLAIQGIQVVRRWHSETADPAILQEPGATAFVDPTASLSLVLMVAVVIASQFALVSIISGSARPASICTAAVAIFLSLRYSSQSVRSKRHRARPFLRGATMLASSFLLTLAGLTPYLAVAGRTEQARQEAENLANRRKMREFQVRPQDLLPPPAAHSFWNALLQKTIVPQISDPAAKSLTPPNGIDATTYARLNAVFGEGANMPEPEATRSTRHSVVSIASGESYAALILKPPPRDHPRISPPQSRRFLFTSGAPNHRQPEPLTIPFSGVYWFFRAPERRLPIDAIEARGDPTTRSFRTTDFTPMAMEARQNFGQSIPTECCRAIEVVLSNRDRRPNTVEVELMLVNTRLPGRPSLYLGRVPVRMSTRPPRFQDPPAVDEVLTFPIPLFTPITAFDEAIIHFQLNSPRQIWSARIAIVRFRLMPRSL